jgi:hypothetical protein
MNENLQTLLDAIAEASTHAHLSTYLPNLQNENPAQCLLIYVTQPRFPEPQGDASEYVTVETPVEISLRMMGGLDPYDIIGIFPLHQADEAVCLAELALEQALSKGQ